MTTTATKLDLDDWEMEEVERLRAEFDPEQSVPDWMKERGEMADWAGHLRAERHELRANISVESTRLRCRASGQVSRDRRENLMARGSNKHGGKLDDKLQSESEELTRSGRESHVEGEREKEASEGDSSGSGHRVDGTGSSADEYSLADHGEEGGASHPQPKD
jgi:hypothetical protein